MNRWLPVLAFALLASAVPVFVTSNAALNFLIMALLFAFLGQAWNVLGGYAGQFSFGHAAFFGTGAYATAILQVRYGWNPWLALPAAVAAGGAVGAFMGAVSFRYGLRGSYFALVTLAFAEVLRILATSAAITGGGAGLLIPLDVRPGNFQFGSRAAFYFAALALVVFGLVLSRWLEAGRFGAWLMAIRENEGSAAALGVDAFRCKLAAIVLSAAMTAAGGVFYAQYFLYLDPGIAYGPRISVEALLVPIIGGLGTAFGPILGSVVVHGLGELVSHAAGDAPGVGLMVYGLLLIVILRFLPRGLIGLVRRLAARRRPAGEAAHAS
jgi:branched-chain amino acid transport system permease protein